METTINGRPADRGFSQEIPVRFSEFLGWLQGQIGGGRHWPFGHQNANAFAGPGDGSQHQPAREGIGSVGEDTRPQESEEKVGNSIAFSVLYIENDDNDFHLVDRVLRKKGADWQLHHARGFIEAEEFKDKKIHCILLDMNLGETFGPETLARAKEMFPTTPILILSGALSEKTATYIEQTDKVPILYKDQIHMEDRTLGKAIVNAIADHSERSRSQETMKQVQKAFDEEVKPKPPEI